MYYQLIQDQAGHHWHLPGLQVVVQQCLEEVKDLEVVQDWLAVVGAQQYHIQEVAVAPDNGLLPRKWKCFQLNEENMPNEEILDQFELMDDLVNLCIQFQ